MSFQGKYKINQELEIIEDEINEIRLTVNNLQKKG